MTNHSPRRYRLLAFDWDGTIRDSIASIVSCGHSALGDVQLQTTDALIRSTVGLALEESVPIWSPGIPASSVQVVLQRYRHHWLERFHAEGGLYSGVEDALSTLSRSGYMLAVATGKSRAGLDRDWRQLGGAESPFCSLFSASRTADESAAKPSPHMLLELMEEMGVSAQETLMVGDTTHDLQMAKNAGVDALAVLGGAMERVQLAAYAIAVLDGVAAIPEWLKRAG